MKRRAITRLELIIAATILFCLGFIIHSHNIAIKTLKSDLEYIQLGQNIQSKTAEARLRFDEAVEHNERINVEKDVFGNLNEALAFTEIALNGGTSGRFYLAPIQDQEVRVELFNLKDSLNQLKDLTKQRWDAHNAKAKNITALENQYDSIFATLNQTIDRVESMIGSNLSTKRSRLTWARTGSIIATILLFFAVLAPVIKHKWNLQEKKEELEKRIEQRNRELAYIEEMNRKIVDAAVDGIAAVDSNGLIRTFNPAAENIFQYSAAEILGRPANLLFAAADNNSSNQNAFDLLVSSRNQHPGETREWTGIRKDGTRFPMEIAMSTLASNKTTLFIAFITDITSRKAVEEELKFAKAQAQKSSSLFETVLQTAGEGILAFDDLGTIVIVNRDVELISGFSRNELLGQDVQKLLPKRYRAYDSSDFSEYLEKFITKILNQTIELEGLRKDGTEFPIEMRITETKSGDVRLFTAAVRDVTDQKQAQAAMKQARDEAEAAARTKSDFLANMSHEIRTPMNAVIGMTGLLLDTNLSEEQREYVETIRGSGEALLTIINDILDFSKIESGKLEMEHQPFNVQTCIEESIDLVAANAAAKSLDLSYWMDTNVPAVVVGDMTRLRQILVNLLTNAVKFTSVGEVVVSVASEPDVTGLSKLKFSVADTGIGIPKERTDRLFRSFSQVDASTTRQYGGTGLGLAISKKLCEMMGGEIWVESEVDQGSTFHFSILALPASESLVHTDHTFNPALKGKRILIVDDNDANLTILARQLKSWNLKPIAIKSPKLALELILNDEQFDAAIIDMIMPDMDGIMLAREIRKYKSKQQMPLLMVTSMGKRERGKKLEDEAFDAFLTKPIKQSQLADALNRLLDGVQSKEADQPSKNEVVMNQENQIIRILIAEDNPTNQKVATRMLSKLGYRADVVANGLEAIEAVRDRGYDLVFMDMQMPELDGLEATRQIRKMMNSSDTPWIVAMTANALRGDRERCIESGMNDYISKPVQIENLKNALELCAGSMKSTQALEECNEIVLDQNVISKLRELNEEGDSDIVADMMTLFLEDAPPRMNGMHDSFLQHNATKLREYSHSLKGSLTTLGATKLAAICIEIEEKARAASFDGVADLLKKADVEFSRLKEEMEHEIQSSSVR